MNRREMLKATVLTGMAGGMGGRHLSAMPSSGEFLLENAHFSVEIDPDSGALSSLRVKQNDAELIGERRLMANFRLCVPLPGYLCNYVDGMAEKPAHVAKLGNQVLVELSGMRAERGQVPIDLHYSITLDGDMLRFRARLTNHSPYSVSEFWFPRIGGWTSFGSREAAIALPDYTSCHRSIRPFRNFPGVRGLGAEAAEFSLDYPGMVMPWWDVHDAKTNTGLYLGYHDPTFRYSTWHMYLFPEASGVRGDAWLKPEQAAGKPVGLVFSHVRYPFIGSGESYDTGEFILHAHPGDWHQGSQLYREWFLKNFPFDKSKSWLRKQSVWFSSIILQPEDRVIADYKTYDRWCQDAERYGVRCDELIGWPHGGLDRDDPVYVPAEVLGGREGYRALLRSIRSRGSRCLSFVNYNVMDGATSLYKEKLKEYRQQDQFGQPTRPMWWGESTLLARKGLSVHHHHLASVVPDFKKLLISYLIPLVADGADGFQIDKLVAGSTLDFNPLNSRKPDVALCAGLVEGIAELLAECRKINPEFCFASEASQDRLIPYIDVYYRAAGGEGISSLRYVFPEWTAVQHVGTPRDFRGVNGAVLTGAVICVEPGCYQRPMTDPLYRDLANYIREVERIRRELADIIFLGSYHDNQGAEVTAVGAGNAQSAIAFAVHGEKQTDRRAIVVANTGFVPCSYRWRFTHRAVRKAKRYEPFQPVQMVYADSVTQIKPLALHILVEEG